MLKLGHRQDDADAESDCGYVSFSADSFVPALQHVMEVDYKKLVLEDDARYPTSVHRLYVRGCGCGCLES